MGIGELKHDDMKAKCDSGDGSGFYASMYPGGVLSIEIVDPDDKMFEIELPHSDALRLAALIGRNTPDKELMNRVALATIDRDLVRLFGERCDEFEITCTCCVAWRTRDDLELVLEVDVE